MPGQRTHTSLTTYRLIADLRGLPEPEPATRIRAACATDVPVVDQLYGTAHPAVPDWMAVTDLDQTVLGARYRAYGLERRRIILVAEHEGSVCGTVACWWASEGMSFSFLENAATDLYVTTSLPEDQRRRVAFSLVVAALRLYAALGRPYAVLVLDDEIERLVKGLPLLSTVPVKRYANVTVSAEDLPATRAYWEKFYAAQPQAGEIEWMAAG
jgi:hypothetical protein